MVFPLLILAGAGAGVGYLVNSLVSNSSLGGYKTTTYQRAHSNEPSYASLVWKGFCIWLEKVKYSLFGGGLNEGRLEFLAQTQKTINSQAHNRFDYFMAQIGQFFRQVGFTIPVVGVGYLLSLIPGIGIPLAVSTVVIGGLASNAYAVATSYQAIMDTLEGARRIVMTGAPGPIVQQISSIFGIDGKSLSDMFSTLSNRQIIEKMNLNSDKIVALGLVIGHDALRESQHLAGPAKFLKYPLSWINSIAESIFPNANKIAQEKMLAQANPPNADSGKHLAFQA